MKNFALILLLAFSIPACSQKQKGKHSTEVQASRPNKQSQITQGVYICWQNSPHNLGGRRPLGDMTVIGNSYGGDLYGKGSYSFDPSTKMVRFDGGGFDQRKNGDEWIGFFYKKGEEFLDGSEGKAANDMLIVTKLSDWNKGLKKAWVQQCDLK